MFSSTRSRARLQPPDLDKAQTAGCKAIVVTVDQQASSTSARRTTRTSPRHGPRAGADYHRTPRQRGNPYRVPDGRLWYEWPLLDELRKMAKVPLLVKGIVSAEDARLCLEHGVDAIFVSNHGGRSWTTALPRSRCCRKSPRRERRVPILFDGGIRRGSDILKALASAPVPFPWAACRSGVWEPTARRASRKFSKSCKPNWFRPWRRAAGPRWASIDKTLVRTEFL